MFYTKNYKMERLFLKLPIISFIFLISCSSNLRQKQTKDELNYIQAIKYMGTITTQPYSIGEEMFWRNTDEHVKLIIRNNEFIEDVKAIKDTTSKYFGEYNYAFIVIKGNKIDTLYSDYTLKTWIIKRKDKEEYIYDEKGEIAKNLRNRYSFFNDCW